MGEYKKNFGNTIKDIQRDRSGKSSIYVSTSLYHCPGGFFIKENRICLVLSLGLLLSSTMFFSWTAQGDLDGEQILSSDDPPTRNDEPIGLYGGRILYDDVALIVNDNSEISKEIGTYFAERRGIPPENIINISTSTSETITPAQFDEVAAQIINNLSERGIENSINYLVTTKGVPLRVSGASNARASFDSELALVGGDDEASIHGNGWVENPYYRDSGSFSYSRVGMRLVTRLTGYTVEEAKRLVDLSEASYGSRGNALMDLDPGKDGSSGYKIGNDWMRGADAWFDQNGYPSLLDENRTFRTGFTDLMAYNSWGSNDGNWSYDHVYNSNFESGTGEQASSWTYDESGGEMGRNDTDPYSGTWSLRMERTGTGTLMAYQERDLPFIDHRYILEGRMKLEGVGSGGVRIWLEGSDGNDSMISTLQLRTYTGTRDWTLVQGVMENDPSIVKVKIHVELVGDGVVFFDSMKLRVIRPHNTWVPGALAETCVSTGGRSFNYGTTYGQSLIADLIRDGVTGVKGYVYEPYLSAISHADILFPAYYSGANLAESYYSGSEFTSWMGTMIGDPKCAPFTDLRDDPRIADEPIRYWIDEDGIPRVQCQVRNDGYSDLIGMTVLISVDGGSPMEMKVDILGMSTTGIDLDLGGGEHEINITIDPYREFRDGNESNNFHSGKLSVNHIPKISVYKIIPPISDNRTISRIITVDVEDKDEIASPGGMNITFTAPDGSTFSPVFGNREISSGITSLTYVWVIPWDAPLGRYDALCEYRDSNGSRDQVSVDPLFDVRNNIPELYGEISTYELTRGGNFSVDLNWMDLDTPDGSLTVKMKVTGSIEGEIEPISVDSTSNSSHYVYSLDPAVRSQQISIDAMVIDRDGAYDPWNAEISTVNRAPEGVITGVGVNIIRSEKAIFSVRYNDPEGQPSREASVMLWGPKGTSNEGEVASFNLDLLSFEGHELIVQGAELEIGSYDLIFDFMDDEYLQGSVRYDDALIVTNAPPSINSVSISVPSSQLELGSGIERGKTVTVRVAVDDPDHPGWGLELIGSIEGEGGFRVDDLGFHKVGRFEFELDIRTDLDWPANEMLSMDLFLTDDQGSGDTFRVLGIFYLSTGPPIIGDMTVSLDETMNATITVSFLSGPGGSFPEKVVVVLTDENGTVLEEELIIGWSLWEVTAQVHSIPTEISIMVTDDSGTVSYWNDTLSIEDPRPTAGTTVPDGSEHSSGNTAIWIFSISLFVLIIVAGVLIFVVISRKRRAPDRIFPPQMMSSSSKGPESEQIYSQVPMTEPAGQRLGPGSKDPIGSDMNSNIRGPQVPPASEEDQYIRPVNNGE